MARIAAAEREALSETRRNQILEAALRVWMRQGFHGSSVEELAREAGLAKGTLYLYFPTKDAILDAIVRRYSLLPDAVELADALRDVPPERAIPLIVERFHARLRERAPLVSLLMREFSLRPGEARIFLERVVLPVNRLFAEYLDGLVARGVVRAIDTFVAARALVGMLMVFVLTQHVFGGHELAPIADERITATAADLFLHGVLATPPRELS